MTKSIIALLLLASYVQAKVLIITHSYNRPDFIEIQAKLYKTFLKDEYEQIIFNDAPNDDMQQRIEQMCQQLGIRCFRVPQHLHVPGRNSPGHRHMNGIAYSLEQIGYNHDGIVAIIDSDMFLLKPFSIEKYLDGHDIAGELQGRKNEIIEVRYLSPALVFMNMQTLPNRHTLSFEGGHIHDLDCDVGGHTYYYFKNNPSVKRLCFGLIHIGAWKWHINCQACSNMTCDSCSKLLHDRFASKAYVQFIQDCPDDIEFFLDDNFLHYRSGSNWNNKPAEYHIAKTNALNTLLAALAPSS
jgi:hypothetical protein